MPGFSHEALVSLFRNRPELAPDLLRDALHVALPDYSEVRLDSADLTDVAPAEYRADLVILLVDGKPVLGIVVEVQLQRDDRKRYTWPAYVVGLRARLSCPACVLVYTVNDAVAAWSRTPIELGPGGVFTPLVVGPALVPVVDDVAVALRDPELAVLSAVAHGHDEAHSAAVGRAALEAALTATGERSLLYWDLITQALSQAAKTALEDLLASNSYELQTDSAKRLAALLASRRDEGLAEGRTEGRTEGRIEGRLEGRAEAVVSVLEARGLTVSSEQRQRILSATDREQIDAWLRMAVSAASADELV